MSDDETANDIGTAEQDAANYVKQLDAAANGEIDDLVPDGEAMIDKEAKATCDFNIAQRAQEVNNAVAAAQANANAIAAAPDSDFAGEGMGGGGSDIVQPQDPDSIMPDNDLPAWPNVLIDFANAEGTETTSGFRRRRFRGAASDVGSALAMSRFTLAARATETSTPVSALMPRTASRLLLAEAAPPLQNDALAESHSYTPRHRWFDASAPPHVFVVGY